MHYCGFCGAPLERSALPDDGDDGVIRCLSCGAAIKATETDDVVPFASLDTVPGVLHSPLLPPEDANLSRRPIWPVPGRPTASERTRNSRRLPQGLVVPLVLAALALVLICGSALVLGNSAGSLHLPGLSSGLSSRQQTETALVSSTGTKQHATASAQSTALASPTGSPLDETPESGTPAVDGTATAIAATGHPVLSVAPLEIRMSVCAAASAQFTVTNTGGGDMAWSAAASDNTYAVSPQSGSLGRGEHQTVTVSGITLSGQITVSAPDATNAPQTVTITCGL